jgi:FtsP/CotA-like multicopper oxidase with cupredoxin domain
VLDNQIPDPLILHWHGLTPPEEADGHPRFAVNYHGIYAYRFEVENRAGTYWYHSHSHMRVGKHTQRGIAGLILVEDDEEAALGLPSGDREIPLILQDRLLDDNGIPVYEAPNTMEGHAGTEPFGNGMRRPFLDVDTALYRFRILNGSNARIFRLERSDGRPFTLIGNDAGLLERPVTLSVMDVAPGERVDLLIDLSEARVGERVMLRSQPFTLPGRVAEVGAHNIHGMGMDLLELRVARRVQEPVRIPERLSTLRRPDPADSVRERAFRFAFKRDYYSRSMDQHHINGTTYEMGRIDARVPFGQTEIWSFVNDNSYPHPIHLHATHFRVLSREGGRGQVMPWEDGLKDTVLVYPDETVKVAVRFDAHRGLFPLHCHNLEHEDAGMMLDILVE